jgi:hypothetical protein
MCATTPGAHIRCMHSILSFNWSVTLRLPTVKPSSSTQAAKLKSGSHLGREPGDPRAGELKVLSILATGIPENTALFGSTLSVPKVIYGCL